MKKMIPKSTWLIFLLFSTALSGLVLRWQLAGVSNDWLASLDWRRAHSHLGFYGVLFPLSWICLKLSTAWIPGQRSLLVYYFLVAAAGLAFLFQGYGFFSIAASTGILIVWLIFAWKNFAVQNLLSKNWESPASISIFLSAVLIFAVAFWTRTEPSLAQQLARAFLTILLFGVFLPAVFRFVAAKPPLALLWITSTLCSALYLTKIIESPWLGFGPIFLSFFIFKNILSSEIRDFHLKVAWILFAVGLAFSGLSLIPPSYHLAIAGVHFLILGPLLITFALVRLQLKIRNFIRWSYEISLASMIVGIALQPYMAISLAQLTAWSATSLVVILLIIVADSIFQATSKKIEIRIEHDPDHICLPKTRS